MDPDYPVGYEPATPEYVLAVLQETARLQDGDILGPHDDISALIDAYNDIAWPTTKLLSDFMNSTFEVDIPLTEWRAAFPSVRRRKVAELCDFLAPRVRRPVIRPWLHVAGPCLPAGAFLTMRSALIAAGFPPSTITPSAVLPKSAHSWPDEVIWKLSFLAPGRCRFDVKSYPPRAGIVMRSAAVFGLIALLVGLLLSVAGLKSSATIAVCTGGAAFFLTLLTERLTGSTQSFPEGCVTFRDLSYRLAGQEPRRRIQPTP
jgi:hypothetical protein